MSSKYPHQCVKCGSPAYLGFGVPPKCINPLCPHVDPDLDEESFTLEAGSIKWREDDLDEDMEVGNYYQYWLGED